MATEKLTLKGVFEKSSNIGFAKAVNKYYKDKPEKFVEHLYKMGLNQHMGLQIAGEQDPVIRKPGDRWWDGTTLTNMAYGYALLVTPSQNLDLLQCRSQQREDGLPAFCQGVAAIRTDAPLVPFTGHGSIDRLGRNIATGS